MIIIGSFIKQTPFSVDSAIIVAFNACYRVTVFVKIPEIIQNKLIIGAVVLVPVNLFVCEFTGVASFPST